MKSEDSETRVGFDADSSRRSSGPRKTVCSLEGQKMSPGLKVVCRHKRNAYGAFDVMGQRSKGQHANEER